MGFCSFLKSLEMSNLFCCGGSDTFKRDRTTRKTTTKETTKTTETTSGNNDRMVITTTTKTTKKTRPTNRDVHAREIRELLDDYRCRRWWPNMEWSRQLAKRNPGKQQTRPETRRYGGVETRAEKNHVEGRMAAREMERTERGDRQQEHRGRAEAEPGERDWEESDQEQTELPAQKNEERKTAEREESEGAEKTRKTRRKAYRVQRSVIRRAQKMKKCRVIANVEAEEPSGIRTPRPPGAYHDDDLPPPPRAEQDGSDRRSGRLDFTVVRDPVGIFAADRRKFDRV